MTAKSLLLSSRLFFLPWRPCAGQRLPGNYGDLINLAKKVNQ